MQGKGAYIISVILALIGLGFFAASIMGASDSEIEATTNSLRGINPPSDADITAGREIVEQSKAGLEADLETVRSYAPNAVMKAFTPDGSEDFVTYWWQTKYRSELKASLVAATNLAPRWASNGNLEDLSDASLIDNSVEEALRILGENLGGNGIFSSDVESGKEIAMRAMSSMQLVIDTADSVRRSENVEGVLEFRDFDFTGFETPTGAYDGDPTSLPDLRDAFLRREFSVTMDVDAAMLSSMVEAFMKLGSVELASENTAGAEGEDSEVAIQGPEIRLRMRGLRVTHANVPTGVESEALSDPDTFRELTGESIPEEDFQSWEALVFPGIVRRFNEGDDLRPQLPVRLVLTLQHIEMNQESSIWKLASEEDAADEQSTS